MACLEDTSKRRGGLVRRSHVVASRYLDRTVDATLCPDGMTSKRSTRISMLAAPSIDYASSMGKRKISVGLMKFGGERVVCGQCIICTSSTPSKSFRHGRLSLPSGSLSCKRKATTKPFNEERSSISRIPSTLIRSYRSIWRTTGCSSWQAKKKEALYVLLEHGTVRGVYFW